MGLVRSRTTARASSSGALLGVPAFMVIRHVAATINPYHWLLVIGLLLIVTILFLPQGIYGLIERWRAGFRRSRP